MTVLKLTQQFVSHEMRCPPEKDRIEFCDSEVPRLYVLCRSNSEVATYFLRYDGEGGNRHKKIGRTNEIELAEARRRAKKLKAEIALGADPCGEEKARKSVLTLSEFFEKHYLPFKMPRKRSAKRDEELFRLRIRGVFGAQRLNQITRHQIQQFHTALREEGLAGATCDHHIKLLKHAFNLAIDWGMLENNPAKRVPLLALDNRVQNYLSDEQLERFLMVLREDANRPVCLIVLFLLSTGARLNEALRAKWSEFDRVNRVWRLPASNTKGKINHVKPISDNTLEILNTLDTEGKYEYLFISPKSGQRFTTIQKVFRRLTAKAGLGGRYRIHDCRHQFAARLCNAGVSLHTIKELLNHSDQRTTERYMHTSMQTLQIASNTAAMNIKDALGAKKPAP